VLAGCRIAHQRLLDTLQGLSDDQARAPSRLPGWSVGHVLTHIARNADSHIRQLHAAQRREATERYPGGREQRAGEIEAGAGRPAAVLVADVRDTCAALEVVWDALDDDAWAFDGGTSMGGVAEPVAGLPWKRWRETEVHHADLGLAFGFGDWSPGYVRRELRLAEMAYRAVQPMGLTSLPPDVLSRPPAERLAWLMGRLELPDLPTPPQWF